MSMVNRILTVAAGSLALAATLGWAAVLVDRAGAIPFEDDRWESGLADGAGRRRAA